MQPGIHTKAAERGSALVTAVIVLSVLAVLSTAYLRMSLSTNREVTSRIDNERSFFLAESAVGEGISALRGGGSGNVASQAQPAYLSDGMMWVESTDLGGLEWQLDARAAVGSGRTALQVIVNGTGSTYGSGLMAVEFFDWGNNGMVDSWNSDVSDYASTVDPLTGCANANVDGHANDWAELGANTEYHGDLYPGPEDTVTGNGTVFGATDPAPDEFYLPPPEVPVVPPGVPLSVANNGTLNLGAGVYSFSDVNIGMSATINIEGPSTIVVDGDFFLGKFSEMHISPTGDPVNVYVTGDVFLDVSSKILSVTQKPAAMNLSVGGEGTDPHVFFENHTEYWGTLYAPQAPTTFGEYTQLYGSIQVLSLEAEPHVDFHYDEALGGPTKIEAVYTITSWIEEDFPVQELQVDRTDPFRIMGQNKATMPMPADAWDL